MIGTLERVHGDSEPNELLVRVDTPRPGFIGLASTATLAARFFGDDLDAWVAEQRRARSGWLTSATAAAE